MKQTEKNCIDNSLGRFIVISINNAVFFQNELLCIFYYGAACVADEIPVKPLVFLNCFKPLSLSGEILT